MRPEAPIAFWASSIHPSIYSTQVVLVTCPDGLSHSLLDSDRPIHIWQDSR